MRRANAIADEAPRTAIVGLGNPFCGDDGVGLVVARRVHQFLGDTEGIDLLEPPNSGFALAERLLGYRRAVIIDGLVDPWTEPGTVKRLDVRACGGRTLLSLHTSGFHEGLALGRAVGFQVPSAIALYGIVIREPTRFAERLSRELESKLPIIVTAITDAEFRSRPRTRAVGRQGSGAGSATTDASIQAKVSKGS